MITWLKFRTDNQQFELNALDVPKDTTSIYKGDIEFDTLLQKLFKGIKDVFNNDDGLLAKAIKILSLIFAIIGLFAILPIIRGITKFIGKKIENKSIKKKKTKGRKK